MSREAGFTKEWQQRLVDDRGGGDDQNFDALVQAAREAHRGIIDSAKSTYYPLRGVLAVLKGALGFETFCQHALITQGFEPQPQLPPGSSELIDDAINLPPEFETQAEDYLFAFQARAIQDLLPPSLQSTGFRFYEEAFSNLIDSYWGARDAAGDSGSHEASKEKLDLIYGALQSHTYGLFRENVTSALDILMTFGISLCRAKGYPCESDELIAFIVDNIDVADDLTSVTREQRRPDAKAGIPPFGYGLRVLEGDRQALGQQYVKATETSGGKHLAEWCAPSLRNGSWENPGYCPASEYNPLRPRTDEEVAAIEASLGTVGLSRLVADGTITSGQLVIAKTLEIAQETIFQQTEWQEQALAARV